jgi:hypothetical protein
VGESIAVGIAVGVSVMVAVMATTVGLKLVLPELASGLQALRNEKASKKTTAAQINVLLDRIVRFYIRLTKKGFTGAGKTLSVKQSF